MPHIVWFIFSVYCATRQFTTSQHVVALHWLWFAHLFSKNPVVLVNSTLINSVDRYYRRRAPPIRTMVTIILFQLLQLNDKTRCCAVYAVFTSTLQHHLVRRSG